MQTTTVSDDSVDHNSASCITDFHDFGSASQTTTLDHIISTVSSTMVSSPGEGCMDDKLDQMMAFLQSMQI